MLSSSYGAASSCFNRNHHQSTTCRSIFSDHNSACGCLLRCLDPVVNGAEDIDQVPFSSTTTTNNSTPSSFGTNTVDSIMPASGTKKKPDNRSKVRTAQGLRDRRVRLSIEMARKFFDLQDMLGFDKPSRTLEWLFDKSSAAILELSAASLSSITSSTFETIAPITEGLSISIKLPASYNHTSQAAVSVYDDVLKTKKRKAAQLLAKESRERARARARSRTVAKLKLTDQKDSNLLNKSDLESFDQTTSNLSSSCQDSIWHSSMMSLESALSQNEEKKKGEGQQQYAPTKKLEQGDEPHHRDCGIKTTDGQENTHVMLAGGLSNGPNATLDWHIGSTFTQPSSFTAHPLFWPPNLGSMVDQTGTTYSAISEACSEPSTMS